MSLVSNNFFNLHSFYKNDIAQIREKLKNNTFDGKNCHQLVRQLNRQTVPFRSIEKSQILLKYNTNKYDTPNQI